jgi:hypothetical protein
MSDIHTTLLQKIGIGFIIIPTMILILYVVLGILIFLFKFFKNLCQDGVSALIIIWCFLCFIGLLLVFVGDKLK